MTSTEDPNHSGYDLLAEQKAFAATKAGVKGLVDAGVKEVPRIFHVPPHILHVRPSAPADDPDFVLPVIDLQGARSMDDERKQIIGKIRDASANWGFFQIVNHGIPTTTLQEIKAATHMFFNQDVEVKNQYLQNDPSSKVLNMSNYNLHTAPFVHWDDAIWFKMAPDQPEAEQIPACMRDIVPEFFEEMSKVGDLLLELFSEALGLAPNNLKEMGCAQGSGLACHYYPPCPQPELALGITQHSDVSFVTILWQDHVGGLQINHHDYWVDVPPMAEALVVNIGDMLQLISNDTFKSVEHRVIVNSTEPRVSAGTFLGFVSTPEPKIFGPIKELLSEEHPCIYRETTIEDFVLASYNKGFNGCTNLSHLKLSELGSFE